MIVRYVVPALGALAISATPIFAADTGLSKDAVTIGGWVDTIFTAAETPEATGTGPLTAKEESGTGLEFSSMASLKVNWNLSDKAKGRINLWFGNQDVNAGASFPGAINLREAYFVYDLGSNLSWTMGKYMNHLGWESLEPTGLYRVNFGIVGAYFYGNDVVGTAIGWSDKSSPFSGSFHVVNGYFNPLDARNAGFRNNTAAVGTTGTGVSRPATRNNYNLAVGLDLVMGFNKDNKGEYQDNINLEFAYDPNAGSNGPSPAGLGGDVFQTGLNATIKCIPKWMFAGEVIYRNTTSARPATGVGHVAGTHTQDLGWALLANYKFMDNASVTANFQEVSSDWRGGGVGATTNRVVDEYTVALLTQPLRNNNFGLNAEISYLDTQEHNAAPTAGYDHAWIGAIEGIIIIP
ncbi:MAG: hypothetical protein H0W83_06305 [Planctomycetes bacterium]|nr:hypothetical protein [Planctomycetota bacterium]